MKYPFCISIIAVVGRNNEIGKDNRLLWHIPEDLKRFRKITQGHTVIMGRKTFESIGKPLPNRENIVVTHDRLYKAPGCKVVDSLESALSIAQKEETDEVFIIGGGNIYSQAIEYADKLYLTVVDANSIADSFFPDYSAFTKKIREEKHTSGNLSFTFLELERKPSKHV